MTTVGDQIGPYAVVEALGEGRFGEVFLVTEPQTGAQHVAKVLHGDVAGHTEQKEEFRLLAHLDHPNLLIPWSLEEVDGSLVLLMQYVDGVPFDVWVQSGESREARLREALPQLLAGLAALHHHGILHLDIKPANVLVSQDDRVFLLDFGLSRPAEDGADDVRGSLAYLAPEVLTGGGYNEATDLFAVGVMCFEALTGSLPFAEDGRESFTARMLESKPATLITTDAELGALVRRLMHPTPQARPTAEEGQAWLGSEWQPPLARVDTLIGRRRELAELASLWAQVVDGDTRVVQVRGASGMGKTALVEHFCDEVAGSGVVVRGRCFERDATPYKGLDSAISQVGRHLAVLPTAERRALSSRIEAPLLQLFPELAVALDRTLPPERADLPPGARRQQAIASLRELLTHLGRTRPLLLWLEDVQWGDRDGALVLLELLQAPAPPGVMVVLTHRPVDTDPGWFLSTWQRARATVGAPCSELDVAPLPPDEAYALAVALLGEEEGAAQLVEAAQGCPFILEVLARAGLESSRGAEETLGDWISELDAASRDVLDAVCLAGRPLPRMEVPGAPGPSELPRTWSALLRRRLVRSVGNQGRVEPYHDRIRTAVLGLMPEERLLALHGELGRHFAHEDHVDAEAAALHLSAGELLDEALPWAKLAAEQATEALAFDQAARLYGLAVCCSIVQEERTALRLREAEALADAGLAARAGPIFLDLTHGHEDEARLPLLRAAMEQLLVSGRVARGREVMQELLDALSVWVPRGRWLMLMLYWELFRVWWRGPSLAPAQEMAASTSILLSTSLAIGKGYGSFDPNLSGLFFLRAARLALVHGQPSEAARGMAYVGALFSFDGSDGGLQRAETWLSEGEKVAREHEDGHAVAFCGVGRGLARICAGDWRGSLDAFDAATEVLERRYANAEWETDTARNTALLALWRLGVLPELEQRAARLVSEGTRRGDLALRVEAALYLAPGLIARGDTDAARAHIQTHIGDWIGGVFHFQHWIARRFLVLADLYDGADETALSALEEDLAAARAGGVTGMGIVRIEAQEHRGALAVQAGRLDVARDAVKKLRRLGTPCARAIALSLEASILKTSGEGGHSGPLAEAATLFAQQDMALHALAAQLVLAGEANDNAGVARITAELTALGITEPRRWVGTFMPAWR